MPPAQTPIPCDGTLGWTIFGKYSVQSMIAGQSFTCAGTVIAGRACASVDTPWSVSNDVTQASRGIGAVAMDD